MYTVLTKVKNKALITASATVGILPVTAASVHAACLTEVDRPNLL